LDAEESPDILVERMVFRKGYLTEKDLGELVVFIPPDPLNYDANQGERTPEEDATAQGMGRIQE